MVILPEEFIDASLRERAPQSGELEFLGVDDRHRWVAEAAHLQRLFQGGLGRCFRPDPTETVRLAS